MDPVLVEFLRARQWERAFTAGNVAAGLDLVASDKVPDTFVIEDLGKKLVVRGTVHGEHPPHGYQAEVVAEKDLHLGRVTMRSSCSCGARLFCPHRYALIFAATEQLEGNGWKSPRAMPAMVQGWLQELARVATAGDTDDDPSPRVDYCLLLHDQIGLVVSARASGQAASGETAPGAGKPVDLSRLAAAGGLHPEDLAIERALSPMEGHVLAGPPVCPVRLLAGPGSSAALRLMLDSGRLFLIGNARDPSPRPLTAGPPAPIILGWDESGHGRVMPVVVLERPGLLPLLLDFPWSLDPAAATLHPLAGKTQPGLHALWAMGPDMAAEDTTQAARAIAALPVALPVPAGESIEHVRPESFRPILRLRRVRPDEAPDWELPAGGAVLGIPVLSYGTGLEFPPLGHGDEPVGKFHTRDKLIIVHRLDDAEAEALAMLGAAGLREVDNPFFFARPEPKLAGAVVPASSAAGDPLAWPIWRNSADCQRLLAMGWNIEESADDETRVVEATRARLCLDPYPKDGIDWFAFDLGVEVEGERVSLLPTLAAAMESHGESLLAIEAGDDDHLAIPLDDGSRRVLRFPMRRFLAMARHVVELFGGIPKPGTGIHPVQAAEVAGRAEDEDIVGPEPDESWRLRQLGLSLRDPAARAPAPPPAGLQATLRPYQEEGFQWLQFLARHHLNGILADDMGLGKTLQTIAHILAEKEQGNHEGRPTLVVAPTSVTGNWFQELRRFAPQLRVLRLQGSARRQHFDSLAAADVVLTSYALLQRDADALAAQRFHLVVLDEAQYIKNPGTKAAESACALDSKHRLALSGTPMENQLGELWSLMRFLMPGLLGSAEEFRRVFRSPIERMNDVHRQRVLNRKVGPLILRRTKDLVAKDLPPKTEITHAIDLHSAQADLYESTRAALDARVREAIASRGLAKSHIIVLDAMLKLRQICCHPGLLETGAAMAAGSAKLDFLMDLIDSLVGSGRRTLVFSQFTAMLARIEERLDEEGIRYLKLTGSTHNRQELVTEFQEGDIPVFLISLKAGGTGLNLTAADTVIHYDPWWNPAVESQASDRAHRIGQTKPVFIHRLICRGTIEERIQELQAKKAGLVDALLSGSTEAFRLDTDTIRDLMAPLAEG